VPGPFSGAAPAPPAVPPASPVLAGKRGSQPSSHAAAEHQQALLLRSLLDSLPTAGPPSQADLQRVRALLEPAWAPYLSRPSPVLATSAQPKDAGDTAQCSDLVAIRSSVTDLLLACSSATRDLHWARLRLPELLLLLVQLGSSSNPRLEAALVLVLRRGQLPRSPDGLPLPFRLAQVRGRYPGQCRASAQSAQQGLLYGPLRKRAYGLEFRQLLAP
jgi:hypothetical protein